MSFEQKSIKRDDCHVCIDFDDLRLSNQSQVQNEIQRLFMSHFWSPNLIWVREIRVSVRQIKIWFANSKFAELFAKSP